MSPRTATMVNQNDQLTARAYFSAELAKKRGVTDTPKEEMEETPDYKLISENEQGLLLEVMKKSLGKYYDFGKMDSNLLKSNFADIVSEIEKHKTYQTIVKFIGGNVLAKILIDLLKGLLVEKLGTLGGQSNADT